MSIKNLLSASKRGTAITLLFAAGCIWPAIAAAEDGTAAAVTSPDTQAPAATTADTNAPVAASAPSVSASQSRVTGSNTASSSLRSTGKPANNGVGIGLRLPSGDAAAADSSLPIRIVMGLTVLAVLPSVLVCVTAFLRIIIVLSMLRHAIGMPETPPNTALIGLALFLTLFTMSPVLQTVNQDAFQPFMDGKLGAEQAYQKASTPLRDFMARQTREQDIALMIDLSKAKRPQTMADVSNLQLIPAFMLSELRAAFQIGFVIFLPFLLLDFVVAGILMSMGMIMVPPTIISLPFKILMFVLMDGWALVVHSLLGSFH